MPANSPPSHLSRLHLCRVILCLLFLQEFNRDDPAGSNTRPIRRWGAALLGREPQCLRAGMVLFTAHSFMCFPCRSFELDPDCKATRVAFANYKGEMDGGVVVALNDGRVQILDPDDGEVLQEEKAHSKEIKRISFNKDKTLLFTCSADCMAKMLDAETLEVLKVYETDRPVNAVVPHPTKDHVLLGGGQDAMSVTTTAGKVGKFECRFFEAVYTTEIGRVKVGRLALLPREGVVSRRLPCARCCQGHFGPINAIGINPDGRSYASGGEDGYVRLHHFDQGARQLRALWHRRSCTDAYAYCWWSTPVVPLPVRLPRDGRPGARGAHRGRDCRRGII